MPTTNRSQIQIYKPFEIVVNTNIAGQSGVGNFQLLLNPSESYRYYVEWGDGSTSASTTTTNLTHSYSVPGFYNVKVYGRFDTIYNNNSIEADKITDVISWGNVKWRRFSDSFEGCANLTGMTTQPPILEVMDDINGFDNLFYFTDFDSDLGSWDTSKIFRMANMFRDSNSFNNGGSPSISGWTTNDCTNMRSMFYNANSFDQPIGSWDVSNVTNMGSMFRDCIFNNGGSPSISGWTTSACTSISAMFRDNPSFNQPIGSWDVSSVTNMSSIFWNADSFDQDIGSWDVSNVDGLLWTFRDCIFNNGGSPSISGWTTSACTTMKETFLLNSNFNQPIGSWDVSNVLSMEQMFNLSNSFDQDIGSWNVSSVTTFQNMFLSTNNFNNGGSPSISGWTTSNCIQMIGMFQNCVLFNQPIGSWDVSNVTNMSNMLNNTSISVDNYNDILTGWTGWDGTGATKTLKTNVTLGATGLNFTSGSTAEDAKNYLITGLTWTITDAGGV